MIDLKMHANAEMQKTSEAMLSYPWENKYYYGLWLSQTYHMVLYSTRLVALAGALCPIDRNDLHSRFVDHAKEERGHEKVCISDLAELGYKFDDFPQMYQSAAMYQVQYFWIQQRHPIAFFGYTLALESLAEHFGPQIFSRVQNAHGKRAAVFLKLHSEDDIEHIKKAYEQLNKLAENEKSLVLENLQLSCALYRSMLIEAKTFSATEKSKIAS